jgi:hypothetical protein
MGAPGARFAGRHERRTPQVDYGFSAVAAAVTIGATMVTAAPMYFAFQYVRRLADEQRAVLPRMLLGCCAACALYVPFASAVPLLAGACVLFPLTNVVDALGLALASAWSARRGGATGPCGPAGGAERSPAECRFTPSSPWLQPGRYLIATSVIGDGVGAAPAPRPPPRPRPTKWEHCVALARATPNAPAPRRDGAGVAGRSVPSRGGPLHAGLAWLGPQERDHLRRTLGLRGLALPARLRRPRLVSVPGTRRPPLPRP